MREAGIELTVYPEDCDGLGTVGHAAFVRLFERARWEGLARGAGLELFLRRQVWPTVRKSVLDFHAAASPGEALRFRQALLHLGRTSFTLRQTAHHAGTDALVATAESVFVCLDRSGQPVPVPEELGGFFTGRPPAEPMDRVTVNGVSLAIETRGTGPAILFIHGFPLDHTIFRHQLDTLSGYRRIALDLRGMGRSDAPDLGYSMATYADDVAAVLEALGESRVVVCGISLGGYVAFELIRRHRDRVRAVVLMDTRAEADSAEGRKARDVLISRVRDQGALAAAEAMLPRFFTPAAPPELIQRVRDIILRTPVSGITGALTAMRERPDSTPLLSELTGIPALVVVGDQDVITPPPLAQAMSSALPEGRLVQIPGAGHLPCIEQPVPTTRAVLKFLQALR